MSLTRWVTVHCDEDDCAEWDSEGNGGHTAKDARAVAKQHGWRHVDGKDFCPDHPPLKKPFAIRDRNAKAASHP